MVDDPELVIGEGSLNATSVCDQPTVAEMVIGCAEAAGVASGSRIAAGTVAAGDSEGFGRVTTRITGFSKTIRINKPIIRLRHPGMMTTRPLDKQRSEQAATSSAVVHRFIGIRRL